MKRVMIVLAATTALTAAAAAQDRGGEFGRGPMRDQFARGRLRRRRNGRWEWAAAWA